jgi:hypothetical protein
MGYKLFGFVVWRVLRRYLHHKFPHARRNLAIAGGAGVLVAGGAAAFAATRRSQSD